jgi:Tol biopolymer transport system component
MLVGSVQAEFVSWSPDGRLLAYVACWQELRVLDLASGIDRTVLVDGGLTEQQRPGFSGDGQRVYAVVSSSAAAGLLDTAVGVDLGTGDLVRVPMPPLYGAHGGAPVPIRSVQGSRSGRAVGWTAGPNPPQIVVFGSTGQVELRRTGYGPPVWRPTADQLIYSMPGRGLILLDVGTGNERVLDPAGGMNPVWSPDGHRIAYMKMISNTPTAYVIDVATAKTARLVPDPADSPTWSADGQWIAYERQARNGSGYWNSLGVSEVPADGSGTPVQLTPDDGSSAPVFAPLPPGP